MNNKQNIKIFLLISVQRNWSIGHRCAQQHEKSRSKRFVLQSRTKSGFSDLYGIVEEVIPEEWLLVQQRSCTKSRNNTTCAYWTGMINHLS